MFDDTFKFICTLNYWIERTLESQTNTVLSTSLYLTDYSDWPAEIPQDMRSNQLVLAVPLGGHGLHLSVTLIDYVVIVNVWFKSTASIMLIPCVATQSLQRAPSGNQSQTHDDRDGSSW